MLLYLLLTISISTINSFEYDSDQSVEAKFDRSHETVSVVIGKRALLPCYVSLPETKNRGIGSFKVIWMKLNSSSVLTMEDRAINGDPRISLLHAYAEEWNLQINDIDEDDAGIYRCFINNGRYKTVTLEVKVPPKIIDELTTEAYPAPISTGSNFTIKCYAHGKPTPNIRILSYDQADGTKIISETNEVTIYNISRHTNRRYECIAGNNYPPDVGRSFQLTIHYRPEITLFINDEIISNSLFRSTNHREIRLKCQILMNPIDKIYWIKDNKKYHSNYRIYEFDNYVVSELIIRHFTFDDQGEYTCMASNSLGVSSKNVEIVSLSTTTTTTTTATIKTTTNERRRKRPKYTRTIKFMTTTDYSRMMTLSSKGVNPSYSMIILLFSIIHSVLF